MYFSPQFRKANINDISAQNNSLLLKHINNLHVLHVKILFSISICDFRHKISCFQCIIFVDYQISLVFFAIDWHFCDKPI